MQKHLQISDFLGLQWVVAPSIHKHTQRRKQHVLAFKYQ